MTTFRKYFAIGATAAVIGAVCNNAVAQEDLLDLIDQLNVDEVQQPTPQKVEQPIQDDVVKKAEPSPVEVKEETPEIAEEPKVQPADDPVEEVVTPVDDKQEVAAVEEQAKLPPANDKSVEPAPAQDAEEQEVDIDIPAEDKGDAKVVVAPSQKNVVPTQKNLLDDIDSIVEVDPTASEDEPLVKVVTDVSEEDAQLLDKIGTTLSNSSKSLKIYVERLIANAELCMEKKDFKAAIENYISASRSLKDSPRLSHLDKVCQTGIAEGLYQLALSENSVGRRQKALEYMEKAIGFRHPKARHQYDAWVAEGDPNADKPDASEILHRRNDADYKETRVKHLKHLKRSKQFLAVRDIENALAECELVLADDPNNQEAIALLKRIEAKRKTILKQEREAIRDGMIADVDEAWRRVYAVNVSDVDVVSDTTKTPTADGDTEASVEQNIINRMKEMRLPFISFKSPATILDAVEFFRQASKDYDDQSKPLEQRGFNFFFKPREGTKKVADAADDANAGGFSAVEESAAQASPWPEIPMISASDITFYEALKLVCESVEYKFTVKGPMVTIMHKSESIEEMHVRSFPVLSSFMDRMGTAKDDVDGLRASGGAGLLQPRANDDAGENTEQDWKEFFSLMGVEWPEGSSIIYIKTLGKLRVKNTLENLAELEKALNEMNMNPVLIEIETRFVEVCQDDLNSLGFEWILNSDYSLGLGSKANKLLGLNNGGWKAAAEDSVGGDGDFLGNNGSRPGGTGVSDGGKYLNGNSNYVQTQGASWVRAPGAKGSIGMNATGGDSGLGMNNRYLSTLGNHISGEGYSHNDQFMKFNAFLGKADLSMILHMLAQRSDTDLLSAPKVLTRQGEQAVIKVITEYRYPLEYDVQISSSSSNGGNGSYGGSNSSQILAIVEPQQFTTKEVGVILDVTPVLNENSNNLIDLTLNTQVVDEPTWKNYGMRIPFSGNSSLQNFEGIEGIFTGLTSVFNNLGNELSDSMKAVFAEKALASATSALDGLSKTGTDNLTYYDAPMEQPFFHIRQIDSKVSVYPGATIVMGGLITERRKAMDDKVPFFGDLPFVGRLFRSHSEQSSKRNLLIFVTTRLVDAYGREVNVSSAKQENQAQVKPAPQN